MAFEFLCPNGHLLQGDESMAGQQVQCPHCSILFIVPQPVAPGGAPFEPQSPEPQADPPAFHVGPFAPSPGAAPAPEEVNLAVPGQQEIVHLKCPSGHDLEVPRDMLNQDAMCPYCNVVFRLRFEDTAEYRQKRQEERELKERKMGTAWMNWAIAIAVVVILGVILLFVIAAST